MHALINQTLWYCNIELVDSIIRDPWPGYSIYICNTLRKPKHLQVSNLVKIQLAYQEHACKAIVQVRNRFLKNGNLSFFLISRTALSFQLSFKINQFYFTGSSAVNICDVIIIKFISTYYCKAGKFCGVQFSRFFVDDRNA